jgi:hypothetical protein
VGAIEVTTLVRGDCEYCEGDRRWVSLAPAGGRRITVKKVVGVVWQGRLHKGRPPNRALQQTVLARHR